MTTPSTADIEAFVNKADAVYAAVSALARGGDTTSLQACEPPRVVAGAGDAAEAGEADPSAIPTPQLPPADECKWWWHRARISREGKEAEAEAAAAAAVAAPERKLRVPGPPRLAQEWAQWAASPASRDDPASVAELEAASAASFERANATFCEVARGQSAARAAEAASRAKASSRLRVAGTAALRAGDAAAATALYSQALAITPLDAVLLSNLAAAHTAVGRTSAVVVAGGDPPVGGGGDGSFILAVEVATRGISLAPRDPKLRWRRAQAALALHSLPRVPRVLAEEAALLPALLQHNTAGGDVVAAGWQAAGLGALLEAVRAPAASPVAASWCWARLAEQDLSAAAQSAPKNAEVATALLRARLLVSTCCGTDGKSDIAGRRSSGCMHVEVAHQSQLTVPGDAVAQALAAAAALSCSSPTEQQQASTAACTLLKVAKAVACQPAARLQCIDGGALEAVTAALVTAVIAAEQRTPNDEMASHRRGTDAEAAAVFLAAVVCGDERSSGSGDATAAACLRLASAAGRGFLTAQGAGAPLPPACEAVVVWAARSLRHQRQAAAASCHADAASEQGKRPAAAASSRQATQATQATLEFRYPAAAVRASADMAKILRKVATAAQESPPLRAVLVECTRSTFPGRIIAPPRQQVEILAAMHGSSSDGLIGPLLALLSELLAAPASTMTSAAADAAAAAAAVAEVACTLASLARLAELRPSFACAAAPSCGSQLSPLLDLATAPAPATYEGSRVSALAALANAAVATPAVAQAILHASTQPRCAFALLAVLLPRSGSDGSAASDAEQASSHSLVSATAAVLLGRLAPCALELGGESKAALLASVPALTALADATAYLLLSPATEAVDKMLLQRQSGSSLRQSTPTSVHARALEPVPKLTSALRQASWSATSLEHACDGATAALAAATMTAGGALALAAAGGARALARVMASAAAATAGQARGQRLAALGNACKAAGALLSPSGGGGTTGVNVSDAGFPAPRELLDAGLIDGLIAALAAAGAADSGALANAAQRNAAIALARAVTADPATQAHVRAARGIDMLRAIGPAVLRG